MLNYDYRSKIQSVTELGSVRKKDFGPAKKVVLAHGTFDLVHLGHVRHLRAARQMGDALFVTITADKFVSKGPDRPIFSQDLRAEMLSAFSFVDGVAIIDAVSSTPAIEAIKPNFYVKGSDYQNSGDDLTGNIQREQKLVESFGGKVVFTDEITFSSSHLINQHLNFFSPQLSDFLKSYRKPETIERLINLIDLIKDYRIMIVGEAIIDQYTYVYPLGKPPKEHLVATCFDYTESFPGGVIAAANHVADFCKEVVVLTCTGDDQSTEKIINQFLKPNVKLKKFTQAKSVTIRKERFVDSTNIRKLFEVYHIEDKPISEEGEIFISDYIKEHGKNFDVVIANDFGHGMMSENIIQTLIDYSGFLAANAQTNSGNAGFNLITKYPKADYICLDGPEARLAVSDKTSTFSKIAGESLPHVINCPHIIVTKGREGCVTYAREKGVISIPVFTRSVVDTMGAGDAFLAITSPLVKAKADIVDVGFIGNAVGALTIGIIGHRSSVEKVALLKFLTALLK